MMQIRTRQAMRWTALLAAIVVAVAACGEGETGGSLDQTAWDLTELGDTERVPEAPVNIVFGTADAGTGDTFGSTGCNGFNGSYQTEGDTISIGPLATTLVACTSPAAQAQEQGYLAALETAQTYSVTGDTLELANAEGETTARFARSEPSIELTSWQAISINNGAGGVQSVVQGSEVTATFNDIGLFSGFGGCNNYSSAYRVGDDYDVVVGGTIEFAAIAAGNEACDDNVQTQEDQYFAAVGNSRRYVIRGPNLELRSSDGALQVLYARTLDG